jgi:magnesium transporter
MPRPKLFSIRRQTAPGAPPGTLISPDKAEPPIVDVISYSSRDLVEHKDAGIEVVRALHEQEGITWVNLTGLGDANLLVQIADIFGLHQLALEDVLNVHQRPKIEEFDDYLFIVARMIDRSDSTETEQISMFLGENYVLSVQENSGDCFDAVRERLRLGRGLIRSRGADYLCYALLDSVVDAYFPTLERLGEDLEQLEDAVVSKAEPSSIRALHEMKREFLALRRAIWPVREMLNTLVREEHFLLSRDTQLYLRDCYDHAIQLMDIVETYRELASGLMDVYISSVSAKLNEIMKVLTIIATVFMPLGFIASLYGMNFDRTVSTWNMPELGWGFGYLFALGLMSVCAIGLLLYFWRKGWLTQKSPFERDRRD